MESWLLVHAAFTTFLMFFQRPGDVQHREQCSLLRNKCLKKEYQAMLETMGKELRGGGRERGWEGRRCRAPMGGWETAG